jgi:hypothetical protein
MSFGLSNRYSYDSEDFVTPPDTTYQLHRAGERESWSYYTNNEPGWKQFMSFLGSVNSLIDPYILTDQEKYAYQAQIARAEAEKASAEAKAIQVQPQTGMPGWVWILGAAVVVVIAVLLLRE